MERKTLDGKQELIKYLLWCISWKISSIGYGIMLMSPSLSVPSWLRGQLGGLFSGLWLQERLGKLFIYAAQAKDTEQAWQFYLPMAGLHTHKPYGFWGLSQQRQDIYLHVKSLVKVKLLLIVVLFIFFFNVSIGECCGEVSIRHFGMYKKSYKYSYTLRISLLKIWCGK